MVVGICRIRLSIPASSSLKAKRAVVRRILDRARSRFHVAAAEVADQDLHGRATLGFAVVSNDGRHANSMLDTLTSFVAGATEAAIVDRRIEIVHFNDGVDLREDRPVAWDPSDADGDWGDG